MKIQTTALIDKLFINGRLCELPDQQIIELEFSAIDTGGGFKDPILDFSFSIDELRIAGLDGGKNYEITLKLSDPQRDDNKSRFTFKGNFQANDERNMQVHGRLKEDRLSRDLIGFVMKRLR